MPEEQHREIILLHEAEAAEWLTITPWRLADWRRRGYGPSFVLLGRSIRYRPEDLRSWVSARVTTLAREV